MIPPSIMAIITGFAAPEASQNDRMPRQYDLVVLALMRERPDLSQSSAARLLNELLEIHAPDSIAATSHDGTTSPLEGSCHHERS